MAGLTINDFRSVMGKYNLGSLQLEGELGDQKLKLVNNHNNLRSLRNATPVSPEANEAVRRQFMGAIEKYLQSRGFDLSADTSVGRFLAAVRQDLLDDSVKAQDLSRSGDVARILDKLDAAIELGDFSARPSGKMALKDRFCFAARMGRPAEGNFHLDGDTKAGALAKQTLVSVRRMLTLDDAGNLPTDKQLLKLAAKGANISDTRATTYLMTRPETILVRADKYLHETLAQMKSGELNELVSDIGKANLARLAIAKAVEEIHADTVSAQGLAGLSGNRRQAANMIMGLDSFDGSRLAAKNELNNLLAGLSRLAAGGADACKVSVCGQEITLARNGAGSLTATLGKIRFAAFGNAQVLLRNIENALVNGGLTADQLASVYRNKDYLTVAGQAPESLRRARVIGSAIIRQASGLGEVELQALSDANVKVVTDAILTGRLATPEDISRRVADLATGQMYSDATLKTVNDYLSAPAKVQKTALIAEARTDTTPPVNKLLADLFTNADVWVVDNTSGQPGGRLQQTLLAHKDTLLALLDNRLATDSLPTFGGAETTGVLDQVLALLREKGVTNEESLRTFVNTNANDLAALEETIDRTAETVLGKIQELFAAQMAEGVGEVKADTREVWEKSLDEIIAEQKKSSGSVEGQFVDRLLREYLKRSSTAEKRSMLASLVSLTTGASNDVQKFSAVLKGAGPVFQKLLQGFPEDQVPVLMRGVFADMKSHLAPIPDTVVKATLAKVVADSNGTISSVSLDKTLGSASVGQAFLCTVNRPDGTSQKAVVKMLKPDVQNRFSREVGLLRQIAGEVGGGMKETLEGRIATIKDELNFNVEAENIKGGQVYNKGGTVKSVELFKGVASDMNVLVMTLAEGDTVDTYIANTVDGKIRDVKSDTTSQAALGSSTEKLVARDLGVLQKSRATLISLAEDIARKQTFLMDVAKSWFDEAVFGKGFFQGDMHAGNILVSDKGATVIDFGNAKSLNPQEALCLKKLICSTAAGNVDKFLEGLDELLKGTPGGTKLADETTRGELKTFLTEIFGKGRFEDTDARLFVAMNALQDRGIEIPSAVYNYTSSQNRLKNAIAELGAKLDEVKLLLTRTVMPVDTFYETSAKHGDTRAVISKIGKVRNFIPVVARLKEITMTGFTPEATAELAQLKASLAPEDRPAVVDELMSKPELLDAVVKPTIELFRSIGTADAALGKRLADAEGLLAAAASNEARKTALTALVDGLHDIQLGMVDDAERVAKLAPNQTMGDAFAEVIKSKISDGNGGISKWKAIGLCTQIGGVVLGQQLCDKLSSVDGREEREKTLDDMRYWNELTAMNMWPVGDAAILKSYARAMNFSAVTKARLGDDKFKFADSPEAREVLMKEIAKNVKVIYVKEGCRGLTPTAKGRDIMKQIWDPKLGTPTFKAIDELAKTQYVDNLPNNPNGDLKGFDAVLAYVFTYLEMIEAPGFLFNLANEQLGNENLLAQLATELDKFLTLDDSDVEQIVDATFANQAELRNLDVKTLDDNAKTQLRNELRAQIRDDFQVESTAIKGRIRQMLYCIPRTSIRG